jgi:hypothetical protein
MTNYQRLLDAGLISPTAEFSDSDKALIESLTSTEVDSMISVHMKMGDFLQTHAAAAAAERDKGKVGIVF